MSHGTAPAPSASEPTAHPAGFTPHIPGGRPIGRPVRSLWVRILLALTSTTALLATVAIVAAAAVVPPIGARRTARAAAEQEVTAQIGDGERIIAKAYASQRRWTDMWRESFGVVVATDRRLLYVGAPPTPLLRPRDDGPLELLVESYPYESAFTLDPRTLWRGRVRGLVLRTPLAKVDFLVDDGDWEQASQVAVAAARARRAVTEEMQQLDATTRSPLPAAAEYVPHVVRRGETLTGLAVRFRTSPDVLRQLNQLRSDNIQAGQRLRVPKVIEDSMPE